MRGWKPKSLDLPLTQETTPSATGVKFDADKNRVELLDVEWLEEVGHVLTFGAKKYSEHNWRGGMPWTRLVGSCLRHIFAIMRGETHDSESGLTHVGHASCCLMFLFWMMKHRPELDDRYIPGKEWKPIERAYRV